MGFNGVLGSWFKGEERLVKADVTWFGFQVYSRSWAVWGARLGLKSGTFGLGVVFRVDGSSCRIHSFVFML